MKWAMFVENVRIDTVTPVTTDDYVYNGEWINEDALIILTPTDAEPSSG